MVTFSSSRGRALTPLVVLLAALAWLALVAWGASPYARYLDHAELGSATWDEVWAYPRLAALFVLGWTLMASAMMLPTSLPLVQRFDAMTRRRADHTALMSLLVAGYLVAWAGFGLLAHVGDVGIHVAVATSSTLEEQSWAIAAATLAVAGAYQFSSLKYRCLAECRSPVAFITARWHGGNARAEAWRLGLEHGAFCVGCCWSLMLLMFVVGVGNLAWMLLLGTVMAVEKNFSWGRRLTLPLGATLGALAIVVVVLNV